MGHQRPPRPATLDRFRRVSSDELVLEKARAEIRFLLHDKFLATKIQEGKTDEVINDK